MNAEITDDWFDPQATTFGDRVAGARERAGMTQAELSRRMGIKVKTLKAWEDDLSEPRANKLSMMAGLLNVSLTWLLSGEGDGPLTPGPGDGEGLSVDAIGLLAEIRDVRAQMAATSQRLVRLEEGLRDILVRAEPVE